MNILQEIGYTGVPARETKQTTDNILRCLSYFINNAANVSYNN